MFLFLLLQIVPFGFRKILNWIKNNFNSPDIFITEAGSADDGRIEDDDRIEIARVSRKFDYTI